MNTYPPVVIHRLSGGPVLVLEQPHRLAEAFFTLDESAIGPDSYDAWAGRTDPNRITTPDVSAMNRTMRARSPHDAWVRYTSGNEALARLAAIDPTWRLIDLAPDDWARLEVSDRLSELLTAVQGPYRNLAVLTKVLHLKRPNLIPVLDSLVAHQIGATLGVPAIRLIEHLREQGRVNIDALHGVEAHLAAIGIDRSLVRILDALLWVSHPAAGLASRLVGWEHRVRPADADDRQGGST